MALSPDKVRLVSYLQQALDAEVGIEIELLDESAAFQIRHQLKQMRSGFEEFHILRFEIRKNKIWIIKDPSKVEPTPDLTPEPTAQLDLFDTALRGEGISDDDPFAD